jgi:hypothetical protein
MNTYISYDFDTEKKAKIVEIPHIYFDCPKFNKDDIIFFDVQQPDGDHIMTPVKVSRIHFAIGWRMPARKYQRASARYVEQSLQVEPLTIESEERCEFGQLLPEEKPKSGRSKSR